MLARSGDTRPGRPAVRGPAPASAFAACFELAVMTLVFAAAAAWPVPDVNETVYLTKARHVADPAWAAGDFFLETPAGHGAFFVLFGPLVAAVGLERAAWVGRWLGWLAVAAGFRHAVTGVVDGRWGRLAAAAIFALAARTTPMAGEWVLGGCEAKVFAWAGVFAGIGELVRGRFARAWCACGAAAALHALVGGWAMLCLPVAWLLDRRGQPPGAAAATAGGVARGVVTPLTAVVAGIVLAAAGMVPAFGLTAAAGPETRAAAARIYVVERLPHHLLLRTFPEAMIARHLLAVLLWIVLARAVPATSARRRLAAFTAATLGISGVGVLIALVEPLAPGAAIGLMRFYWFRMADIVVPLALAVAAAAALADDAVLGRLLPGRPAVIRALVGGLLAADLACQSAHWPVPGRDAPPPRADAKVAAGWADVCRWVRDHAPADACFLTPRDAASFTWRTGRREVVSWKNSPQDAASLVEWRRRILDCFSRTGSLVDMEKSTAALGAERLREVAERYGADHAIVPAELPCPTPLPFTRLYANGRFAVLRLDRGPSERDAEP